MAEQSLDAKALKEIGAKWIEKIRASEKRKDESQWLKDAETAVSMYLCGQTELESPPQPTTFNILHANVETIVPSIYNSTPAPDIRPRHSNKDPQAEFVCQVYERAISAQIDDSRLNKEIEASAQDAYSAGRGVVRVKFDADIEEVEAFDDDNMGQEQVGPIVTNERLIYENVSWNDYREGPAKRWSQVPWVAFRHSISREEEERLTDEGHKKAYDAAKEKTEVTKAEEEEVDCDVWEIWCKQTRSVYFVINETGKVLSITKDPLKLNGFFPMAEPVQPITGTGKRTPVCPYRVYKTLAEELDRLTVRIAGITKGLKVRGAIAADAQDIENLSEAEDNTLIPIANMEGIAAAGGMDKVIVWWPVEKAIEVLRELYIAREQTKQTIYEVTGISDIIRGEGDASETATAQNIKTQWGSLRIKKMQRAIERQVRDLFVISAEIISQHFSIPTLSKMTGLQITPEAAQLLQRPLDSYRIDVESDSTVRADLTRMRGEMGSFLQGTAQFFGTMGPLVQQTPAAAGPVAQIYSSFARQFALGKQAEDAIDQLTQLAQQAAENPPPNPEAEAKKAEMELKGKELQLKVMQAQTAAQGDQGKLMLEAQKLQAETQLAQVNVQIAGAELMLKQRELGLKEGDQIIAEKTAEVDSLMRLEEMQMEKDQQRAVKLGNE